MKSISKNITCGLCAEPVVWKLLTPRGVENSVKKFYEYRCPKCKGITDFHPDYILEEWSRENPQIKFVRKI